MYCYIVTLTALLSYTLPDNRETPNPITPNNYCMKNFLPCTGPAARKTACILAFTFFALLCLQRAAAQTARQKAITHTGPQPKSHKRSAADSLRIAKFTAKGLKNKTAAVKPQDKLKQLYLQKTQHKAIATNIKKPVESNVSYTIISTGNNTYGYDVYNNGRKMVHQPFVPGVAGRIAFTSKEDAEKVAQLVAGKMRSGQMPPSVTATELKNLNIAVK